MSAADLLRGAASAAGNNPDLVGAGVALAAGNTEGAREQLVQALGGTTSTGQAPTVIVQQSTPTWLPWALGAAALAGLGLVVVAARR